VNPQGWIAPANLPVTLVAGANSVGPITFAQVAAPVLSTADSVKRHTSGAGSVDLAVAIYPTITSEPRIATVVHTVKLTYNVAIGGAYTVTPTNCTIGTPTIAGNVLSIPITATTERTCMKVTVAGMTQAAGSAAAPTVTIMAPIRYCDVANTGASSGKVDSTDVAVEKTKSSPSVTVANARYDVNCDRAINSADIALVKSKSNPQAATCP